MDAELRAFRPEDLEALLLAMAGEGWTPSRAQLEALLEADPEGARALDLQGATAGRLTTTCLAASGWLGNLIVDPAFRRRGLGQRLAAWGVERLWGLGRSVIRLEADPPGVGIYRRLGFKPEFESLRFKRSLAAGAATVGRPTERSRPLDPDGLPELLAFDRVRYGDDRGPLLRALLPRARQAFELHRGGELAGFALVVPTAAGLQIGPWVADDVSAAATLLDACLRAGLAAGQGGAGAGEWVVGLPGINRAGVALLEAHGFTRHPSSIRMRLGPEEAKGRPECVFGLLNGAVG